MTQAELLKFFDECTAQMRGIIEAKNSDYTGAGNAFNNFTRVEALGIAATEIGFLTRMTDKLCRITTFAKVGFLKVADEKVTDTLLDLANYCILMAGYLKTKGQGIANGAK